MTIQEYIDKQYDGSVTWFMEEVNQKNHVARIAGVIANMDYLAGRHKVLGREDCYYKGKVLRTRKTILNYAKTVLRFHDTFLLGKKVALSSQDTNTVNTFNDIYKLGQYDTIDYQILVEADFLVNMYEDGLSKESVKASYDNIFRTEAGRLICREMFDLKI